MASGGYSSNKQHHQSNKYFTKLYKRTHSLTVFLDKMTVIAISSMPTFLFFNT